MYCWVSSIFFCLFFLRFIHKSKMRFIKLLFMGYYFRFERMVFHFCSTFYKLLIYVIYEICSTSKHLYKSKEELGIRKKNFFIWISVWNIWTVIKKEKRFIKVTAYSIKCHVSFVAWNRPLESLKLYYLSFLCLPTQFQI